MLKKLLPTPTVASIVSVFAVTVDTLLSLAEKHSSKIEEHRRKIATLETEIICSEVERDKALRVAEKIKGLLD